MSLDISWGWLVLIILRLGRDDFGKDLGLGRVKGWRRVLGIFCLEVRVVGEVEDEIFEREKSGEWIYVFLVSFLVKKWEKAKFMRKIA